MKTRFGLLYLCAFLVYIDTAFSEPEPENRPAYDPSGRAYDASGRYPCGCPGCCPQNNCPNCQPPTPPPRPIYLNPCMGGEPALTYTGSPLSCSPGPSQCPRSHWCHLGATTDTTCCCPGAAPDPCSLPMTAGVGYAQLPRYYYNPQTSSCQSFVYRGMMGNQNCFQTVSECQSTCRVNTNPCARGQPLTDSSGRYLACNSDGDRDHCGRGYWCHYGISAESTVCCPGSEDPCTLPCALGQGTANLQRYFYDTIRRQCTRFVYNGVQGNQNNFLTKEACERKCRSQVNPCNYGEPVQDPSGRPMMCGNYGNICPQRSWCHFGADAETTLCCPGAVASPCMLDLARGNGPTSLSRWYFDPINKCCSQFTYTGLGGNQNNFLSREECQRQCPETENPCAVGDPVPGSPGNRALTCSFMSGCSNGYYCHVGGKLETTVCCTGNQQQACTGLPPNEGLGDDSLSRWYFDSNNKQCRQFVYRGTKGNPNNFVTKEECESVCQIQDNPCAIGEPVGGPGNRALSCSLSSSCSEGYYCHIGGRLETTVCCAGSQQSACMGGLPVSEGIGEYSLPRWYFDYNSKQCREFTYRGAKGNPNNFQTRQECEMTCNTNQNPCTQPAGSPATTCSGMNPYCPIGQWCHIGGSTATTVCCAGAVLNACNEPMSPGIGNENLPRYYYNSQLRQCIAFSYRGTMGNQNSFLSQTECQTKCNAGTNPCLVGEPLSDRSGQPQTCSQSGVTSNCPSGYWCHVGATIETTTCCRTTDNNACTLPRSTGEGNATLPRFGYDPASRQCVQFNYNGLKGNENNFATLNACQATCGEFTNPCIGQPATTPTGQVVFCSSNNKDTCPVNFWCHVGDSSQTTLCCAGATNPCSVPLAPGTGTAQLQRWYYNADSRTCQQFTYFGLGGNQNNFERLSECENVCPSELCALSIDQGTCNNAQTRYAYDRSQRRCVQFNYRGCGGNLNNFATMQECETTCSGTGYRRRKAH